MTRINTNIASRRAIHRQQTNYADLDLRLERLSTGLRINRGRDDPAGLIISESLRSEIRATNQAIENSARASNVISTAEGAMNEVSALLLDLQALIVSAANESGLSEEEVRADQLAIDSILASIDRIGQTTIFGGRRLLDGSNAYNFSAVPTTALNSIAVFSARLPTNGAKDIVVRVTQSAQTARVSFIGAAVGSASYTSAATIELRGTLGGELISFASGTSLAEVRTAINAHAVVTGVSAVLSTTAVGPLRSALLLNSTTVGSDAFVSVAPISGNFIVGGNTGQTIRDVGVDAGVLIDGTPAAVKGLRADIRNGTLDARVYLTQSFGQTLSSASFSITGGGGIFQLTPKVTPNGQIFVGLGRIASTELGNAVTGLLHSLRSGEANDLAGRNFQKAQIIVEEAINQVASYRGRLGSLQRNHIDPNVNAQKIALENITASESIIRDAEMAVEVSALTRAQILTQSTQTVLQIANSVPTFVLSLLE